MESSPEVGRGADRSGELLVRPIERGEVARFNQELDAHHWLGHRLVGETMRYVATEDGAWVALLGFGAAAFKCGPRDRYFGWTMETHSRRLRWVVNNQRFCVLPEGRRYNLASQVLGRALRRISADYQAVYRHPVLAVETFTDPSRHSGTCYAAANFLRLGETVGYRRTGGRYRHHGQPKVVWVRSLRPNSRAILAAAFDHPLLIASAAKRRVPMLDLNPLDLSSPTGLLARLQALPDPRKPRGVRHRLASILLVAAAAAISGASSFTAIGEWARDAPQDVLARLGTRRHPSTGRYVAPHEATLRRALQAVDVERLDQAVGGWLEEQVRQGRIEQGQLAVAVDGKSVRGARQEDGRAVHLFAAMVHREGVVIAQSEVDHKTNEISAFRPLLEPLDLEGVVVTADAMHAQVAHANFLVEEKGADYVFTVKANQPGLLDTLAALDDGSFSPSPH
ncbi:MAG: ISAs1 family transposase [Candidatus Dormibacteria bacterium]